MLIKAVFIGQNNSIGYKLRKQYVLSINQEGSKIIITRMAGGGRCEYESIIAFLSNWDAIILV